MNITITPQNGLVSIDRVGHGGLDLSSIDPSIYMIHWDGSKGTIETKDTDTFTLSSREITSFDEFAFVIPLWEAVKVKLRQEADEKAILEAEAQLAASKA